jgi:hypothetical protein
MIATPARIRRAIAPSTLTWLTAVVAPVLVTAGVAWGATALPKQSVGPNQLKNNAVTTTKIAPRGVTRTDLAPNAVTSATIGASAVTSVDIKAGAVTARELGADAVASAAIAVDAVGSSEVAADAIGASEIAAASVGSSELAPGAITGAALAAGIVDTTQLANGSVTEAKLANGAVTDLKLADDAVTAPKLAAASVGASEVAADAIGTSEIATDAVASDEIAAAAVGSGELAADAMYARTRIVRAGGSAAANGTRLLDANAAVEFAGSGSGEWLLVLEPGIYDLQGASLDLAENVSLRGAGKTLTTIRSNDDGWVIEADAMGAQNGVTRISDLRIENITTGAGGFVYGLQIPDGADAVTLDSVDVYVWADDRVVIAVNSGTPNSLTMEETDITARGEQDAIGIYTIGSRVDARSSSVLAVGADASSNGIGIAVDGSPGPRIELKETEIDTATNGADGIAIQTRTVDTGATLTTYGGSMRGTVEGDANFTRFFVNAFLGVAPPEAVGPAPQCASSAGLSFGGVRALDLTCAVI